MPHIRIRAMTESHIQTLSQTLPAELALLMNTSVDNFTVEKINTIFYRDGRVVKDGEGDPMVEIHWFDRGAEVKSRTAKKITEMVKPLANSDFIAVVFFDLPKTDYFENGVHF